MFANIFSFVKQIIYMNILLFLSVRYLVAIAEWNKYKNHPERVGTFSNDEFHRVVMSNYTVIY